MRKNIFEILNEKTDRASDIKRIRNILSKEKTLSIGIHDYTILEIVDDYCFLNWKNRGHCINLNDFLNTLKYNEICKNAETDITSFIDFLEIVYNIWFLAYNFLTKPENNAKWYGNFFLMEDIVKDYLSSINHGAFYDENNDYILIAESDSIVTATVEILPQDLALDVIKYNHHSLKGDIAMKKAILLRLGAELEPQRQILINKDKDLESNIFFMLNNLNLRHNNTVEGDKWYKKKVAEMPLEELESWYDELYQLMLIGFLTIDNIERSDRVNQLKKEINT